MDLPMNTLVVILIAVLCLAAIIGIIIYFTQDQTVDFEVLRQQACLKLITDCSQDWQSIVVSSKNVPYRFDKICYEIGINDEASCKKTCGCKESGELCAYNGQCISGSCNMGVCL